MRFSYVLVEKPAECEQITDYEWPSLDRNYIEDVLVNFRQQVEEDFYDHPARPRSISDESGPATILHRLLQGIKSR